jgi:predicted  nucleic acid-binding Zn-ribbon protein
VIDSIDPKVLAIYDLVARRRNGIGVAEARNGICTICHVRLRPQVFNNILRNDSIIQCDSCQRILYSAPKATAAATDSVTQSTQ